MEPSRKPQAIFSDMGSKLRPRDGIGTACNQSEELGEDTASRRAISASEVVFSMRSRNLTS